MRTPAPDQPDQPEQRQPRAEVARLSWRPRLLAAALQAGIPLALLLLAALFALFPGGDGDLPLQNFWGILATGDLNYFIDATQQIFGKNITYFVEDLATVAGSRVLPFAALALLDYVISRRAAQAAGSVRAGVLACLWGNLGYLAAVLVCILVIFPFGVYAGSFSAPFLILVIASFLVLQGVVIAAVSLVVGFLGARGGWRRSALRA